MDNFEGRGHPCNEGSGNMAHGALVTMGRGHLCKERSIAALHIHMSAVLDPLVMPDRPPKHYASRIHFGGR